jgi:hypothetical protein
MAEGAVVRAILVELGSRPDVLVYRCNVVVAKRGRKQVRSLPNGHPDILAIHQGRYIAIEAKTETGRQSQRQKLFQQAVERAGGVYVIARSVSDVLEALDE